MIYPSDFNIYPKNLNLKQNLKRVKVSFIGLDYSENNLKKKSQTKSNSVVFEEPFEPVWIRYCNNSTIHGFRYLTDPKMHMRERLTWFILVSLALVGAVYVSYLLQLQFFTNVLATVVETTFFPVYEIPYPAVTICNNNRVNWQHVPAAIEFYLQNASDATISKFNDIIVGLNAFEFGSFDEFVKIKDVDVSDLDHINLKKLYRRVELMFDVISTAYFSGCEEFFIEPCWWRNKYLKCCDGERGLFVMQKSEYGICYAFNSVLNSNGEARYRSQSNYPWRTSSYGDWSGLRVSLLLNDSAKIPNVNRSSGILVMANHPFSWPSSSYFVPTGTSTAVIIKPAYSYTTSEVKRLLPTERQCLYPDEISKHTYDTLPGTLYFRSNCLSECRQQQMIARCNCTIDFLFPTADYPKCNISDLKCLYNYDSLFNYERPPTGNPYFPDDDEGMICECLPECESIDYNLDVSPIQGILSDTDHIIIIDVHFQQSTMVKYRTDVVFDWLDLMVAVGGIAGLFLGCSLISVAEVIFYFIIFIIGLTKIRWTKLNQIFVK